jgi:hypothetical protein
MVLVARQRHDRSMLKLPSDTQPKLHPRNAIAVGVTSVVDTVSEFGEASLELVAWELSVPERTLEYVWAQAIEHGMLRAAGVCPTTGERLFVAVPARSRSRADGRCAIHGEAPLQLLDRRLHRDSQLE